MVDDLWVEVANCDGSGAGQLELVEAALVGLAVHQRHADIVASQHWAQAG
jgi:hypothetical protein